MRIKFNYIPAILSLLFGGMISWFLKEEITPFLFAGKILENRSLFVQLVVMAFYAGVASVLVYACTVFLSRFLIFLKDYLTRRLVLDGNYNSQKILEWYVNFSNKHSFYLYIFLILILYSVIYLPIILNGEMYIYLDIGADTYASYWPMYAFIREYFHSPQLYGWSFQHGLGANIFSAASPWIFDPYNIFIVPFDKNHIDIGIFLAASAKILSLALLAFMYIQRVGYKGVPLIASSVAYTFCGFFVGWGQHYQFATAFVLFTLALYCIEGWLISSRWFGVVVSIALLAAFWPYTFFMAALFLVFYYIFRYLILFGFSSPHFFTKGFVTAGLFLCGIGLSAVSFLPQAYAIVNSPRIADHIFPSFTFANSKEYYTILMRFFSNGLLGISANMYKGFQNYYESPFLYNSILMIFIVPRLFFNDLRKKIYIWPLMIIVFFLLFPHVINPIFGAFNKYSYRWTFVLVPIFSISVAEALAVINNRAHKWIYIVIMILGICVSLTALLGEKNTQLPAMAANLPVSALVVLVSCILYGFFLYNFNPKFTSYFILTVLVVEIALTGFATVNLRGIVPASDKKNISYYDPATIQALHSISESDSGFYRVNKTYDYIYLTDALFQDFYGEKQYSSVIPYYVWEWQNIFDIRGFHSNYIFGFTDRQTLRDISAGKYMLTKEEHLYSGYEKIGYYNDVYVYKNKNATDLGLTYENYITIGDFERLNWEDKQYIQYSAVVVPNDFAEGHPDMKEIKAPLFGDLDSVELKENISHTNVVLQKNEFPNYLAFSSVNDNSEICMEFRDISNTSISASFSINAPAYYALGKLYYSTVEGDNYNENDVMTFDLKPGFHEYYITVPVMGVRSICLNIMNAIGDFSIEKIKFFHRDDNQIAMHASNLVASSGIKTMIVENDYISGIVDLDYGNLVYFSVPFDPGWSAYVDGRPVEKIKANIAFTGVYVGPGKHKVELKYTVPWLKAGLLISGCTLVVLFMVPAFTNYVLKKHTPDNINS